VVLGLVEAAVREARFWRRLERIYEERSVYEWHGMRNEELKIFFP
jgi:hypothetical protein